MSDEMTEVTPVRVHITGSDVPAASGASRVIALKPGYRGLFQAVTLTVNDPAQEILPIDPSRAYAFIVAVDAAIVIGETAASVAAGIGCIIPQTMAWPVFHDGAVYAAPLAALTGTNVSRVSVQQAYER